MAIEALIFDLGGVIVGHDNTVMYERIASSCVRSCTASEVKAAIRRNRWSTGAPIPTLHLQLSEELGYSGEWVDFVRDWSCHLHLDESMLDLVERLAASERVALFSNTNQAHWEFVVAASGGRLERFERYLSHELGLVKPSNEAFAKVIEMAGLAPERMLFIDDLPENIQTARSMGFQAIQFEGREPLILALRNLGLR